jgi:hypothetical protein
LSVAKPGVVRRCPPAVIADAPHDRAVKCGQDAVMGAARAGEPGADHVVKCSQPAVIADDTENHAAKSGQEVVMQPDAVECPPLSPPERPPFEDPNARSLPPVTWLGDLLYNSDESGP